MPRSVARASALDRGSVHEAIERLYDWGILDDGEGYWGAEPAVEDAPYLGQLRFLAARSTRRLITTAAGRGQSRGGWLRSGRLLRRR